MMPSDSTVVVTGISSFVGMHLAQRFSRDGFRVVGTVSKPATAYEGVRAVRLNELKGNVEFIELDIENASSVAAAIERVSPVLWLHHAGYAENYTSHDYDQKRGRAVNVAPLTHLYESLAGRGCSVIITGSGAEYSTSVVASREKDVCAPDTPYGLSKLAETLRAGQLAEQFDVPTRVARLYIPFGAFDNPEKLLAQVIDGLRRGRPVDLSACTQSRDFLAISDLCDAYVALGKDMPRARFDIFNICSGEATILRDFLQNIALALKADPTLLRFGKRGMRPGEAPTVFGSNEKARRALGWSPTPLMAAIQRDLIAPLSSAMVSR
jgi:nucleoside-diphosphate-sugar epimerase